LNPDSNDPIALHFERSREALDKATRDAALVATPRGFGGQYIA
jgi:hypothetical protein